MSVFNVKLAIYDFREDQFAQVIVRELQFTLLCEATDILSMYK
jgi:hypothetical protein